MHVAIALVTYNLLVHVAPVRASRRSRTAREAAPQTAPRIGERPVRNA
jgi:hypothetical protein